MKVANYKTGKVRWVVDYNEDKVEKGSAMRIGGNVAGSREKLEDIFNYYSYKRTSALLKNRFIHLKVAVSPNDKDLSTRMMRQIGEKVVQGLGYKNNPFIIYRHFDTEHDHIHIILSRVTFDGKLVSDSFDGLKLRRIEQRIEQEFELTKAEGRLLTPGKVRVGQRQEKQAISKHKDLPMRAYIQNAVMEAVIDRPSYTEFFARLERRGILMVRHKFERAGKEFFGLSYTVKPDLVKSSFTSKAVALRVGGLDNLPMNTLSSTQEHPLLGQITAQLDIDDRGIPHLCRPESKAPKKLTPVSYRASNLGPFFKNDSIFSFLSGNGAQELERITVNRKKNKKNESFNINLITREEHSSVASIIRATEMRSEERIQEVIDSGVKLEDINKSSRTIGRKDFAFLQSVLNKTVRGKQKEEAIQLSEPIEQVNPVERLVQQYLEQSGRKSITAPTLQLITLITEDKWKQIDDLIDNGYRNGISHAPDPFVFAIVSIPASHRMKLHEFREWFEESIIGEEVTEESRTVRKVRQETALLLKALQAGDMMAIKDLLAKGSPDVSSISLSLISTVPDQKLRNTLILLQTGQIPQSGLRAELPDHKEQKQTGSEEQNLKNKKDKGMESGNDSPDDR